MSPFLLTQPDLADYAVHDEETQDEEWFAKILAILTDDPLMSIDDLFD